MMTASNGNIFRVTAHLCGKFTGPGEFPAQRLVTLSFDVFFDLHPNKRLSKQSWGWWFETPSRPLWPHCNAFDPIIVNWARLRTNFSEISINIKSFHATMIIWWFPWQRAKNALVWYVHCRQLQPKHVAELTHWPLGDLNEILDQ